MNYKEWLEEPCDPDVNCMHCENKQDKLDSALHYMEEIVKQLYSRDDLDIDILDHCLENVCYALDMKPANGRPQIVRRKNPVYLIQDLIDQDSEFLKSIQITNTK